MGFSRQEFWSGLPFPSPGDLPNPGFKPRSPTLQAVSLLSEPPRKPMNTGVGSLSLLQGIFQTTGIELGSPVLQADSLPAELESESEVAQSCPTLFDPVGYSLPGSSLHEILQARILEWVTISFSRGSSQPRD